ncbi:MAG: hypothetical protein ACHQ2F_03745 [Desulfobaccales bacterium]
MAKTLLLESIFKNNDYLAKLIIYQIFQLITDIICLAQFPLFLRHLSPRCWPPIASPDNLQSIRHPAEIPVSERKYGKTRFHLQPPFPPAARPRPFGWG